MCDHDHRFRTLDDIERMGISGQEKEKILLRCPKSF